MISRGVDLGFGKTPIHEDGIIGCGMSYRRKQASAILFRSTVENVGESKSIEAGRAATLEVRCRICATKADSSGTFSIRFGARLTKQ